MTTDDESQGQPLRAWVILIFLAIIWGSSFILMKKGLVTFTSYQVAAMRIFFAGSFIFLFVFRRIWSVPKKYWKHLFLVGLLGNCLPAFLFTGAQVHISSSLAGILNALTPMFTLLVALILFKTPISGWKWWGVIIGLIGTVFLLLINPKGEIDFSNSYGLLIVLATICYALSVNIIRNFLSELDSVTITGAALFPVAIGCTLYLFNTDFISRIDGSDEAWISFGSIIILGVVGTAISVVFFNKLIKISGVVFSSSVTYLIPIVAVLWGIFDGESFMVDTLIGLIFILAGVYMVNRKKRIKI
jgi:drug/metabolite transporter (DMT)-like permease